MRHHATLHMNGETLVTQVLFRGLVLPVMTGKTSARKKHCVTNISPFMLEKACTVTHSLFDFVNVSLLSPLAPKTFVF